MTTMLRIQAVPPNGFWRCGVHHPAKAIDHPIDAFTDDQVAILEAEKKLTVQRVEVEDAPADPPPAPDTDPPTDPDPVPGAEGETDAKGAADAGSSAGLDPDTVTTSASRPTEAGEALAAIKAAIAGLDRDDPSGLEHPEWWTATGKPKTEAVETVLGWQISAAERDAVWAEVEAEKKAKADTNT